MPPTPPSPQPAPNASKVAERLLDDSGRIALDIPCARCEYNLRGLLPVDRCPECSHTCEQSLDPNLLRFSRPGVIRRLRLGAAMAAISIVALVIIQLLIPAWHDLASPPDRVRAAAGVLEIVLITFLIGCWWLFTLPETDAEHDRATAGLRSLARLGIVGLLVVSATEIVLTDVIAHQTTGRFAMMREPLMLMSMVFAQTAMLLGCLGYLSRLAWRVPRPRLAQRAEFLVSGAWVFGITGVIATGWWTAEAMSVVDPASGLAAYASDTIAIVTAFVHMVFGILLIAWLIQFRRSLGRVLSESTDLSRTTLPDATEPPTPSV